MKLKFSIQATRQTARIPFAADFDLFTIQANETNRTVTYRLGYSHDNPANPYLNLRGFVYLTTLDVTEIRISDRARDEISFDTDRDMI